MHKYRQGPDPLESNGCGIRKRVTIRSALCSALGTSHLKFWVQFHVPQCKNDKKLQERVQQRAIRMIGAPDHLCYEERLRKMGLFYLEKRRLRGDIINPCQYLWGGHQEGATRHFSVMPNDKTRANRNKFRNRNFHLNIRKNVFPLRMAKLWNSLPRDVVQTPLEIFKTCLENDPVQSALGDLL